MNLTKLQERASTWNKAYKSKRKRTPEYTISHMLEELGEMAAEWRAGRIGRTYSVDHFGLQHPEGLGSEIADVAIFCGIFAEMNGLDLAEEVACKLSYLEQKLIAKTEAQASAPKGKKK